MLKVNVDYLRRLRRQKRLKIKDVADLIGKAPSTIWRYENEKIEIRADVLFQLAALYEVSIEELCYHQE